MPPRKRGPLEAIAAARALRAGGTSQQPPVSPAQPAPTDTAGGSNVAEGSTHRKRRHEEETPEQRAARRHAKKEKKANLG